MFIQTPAQAIAMGDPSRAFLTELNADMASFYMEHRDERPLPEHYQAAAEHLSDITELAFDESHARDLLALYPHARIKLALAQGTGPTDVRDALADAAALFFMACPWPLFGDKVDPGAFVDQLRAMSALIGFPDASV